MRKFSFRFVFFCGLYCLILGLPCAAQSKPIAQLSFGRVMPNEPVEELISFKNTTEKILEVEEIRLTPPLQAKEVTTIILPNMEGSFKLVLGENRPFGAFEGAVVVSFKDNLYPQITFGIDGFVIPPIEFKPYPVFFTATNFGKQATDSIEILNHRSEPLFLKSAETDSTRFTTKLEILEKGKHYRLLLTLDGFAEPGVYSEKILLHADPPLEEPLIVQANTKIKARVYHFPDSVDLGALPFKVATDTNSAKVLSQTLMVYRLDTDDFEVEATIDLDYINMSVERGPNGDRYQMDLTLIPEKVSPGPIEGTVTIKTNDKEFHTLEVPVTGYILD